MIGPLKLKLVVFLYSLVVYDYKEPSDRWVPCPPGIVNGWGPQVTKMRDEGKLPQVRTTEEMDSWQVWADAHLKDGDAVHRLGQARIARGLYPFSYALSQVTNSQYSHSAFVVIENGHAYTYDATQQSIRRQPFCVYMLDMAGPWCVQRTEKLNVSKSIEYVRQKWNEQTPFDFELNSFDDTKLYCVEMLVRAYRAGGIDLGRPLPLLLIPGIKKWPLTLYGFSKFGLNLKAFVWYVGNYQNGILGSKKVKTIYEFKNKGVVSDRPDQHDPVREN